MRDVISNETIKEINEVIDEILANIDDNVRNIVGAGNYSLPIIFSYKNYSGQTFNVHGSTFRHEIVIDNADGNNLIGDICTVIGDRKGIKLAKAGVEDRHDTFANYWDSSFDIAYDSDTAINGYVFDMQSGFVGEGTGQSKVMSFKLDNLKVGKAYTLTFRGKFVHAQFVSGQESLVRICSTTAETPYLAQVTLEKDTDAHIYRIDFTNNTQDTTLYLNFWFYGVDYDIETYNPKFIADDLIIAGMNIGIISRYIDYNGKWYPIEAGGGTSDLDAIELTYAEYQALTPAEKTDPDKIYFITDYPSGSGVVINPTGTATDTAETIEVDGTIYDFAGTDADAVHTADIGVAGGVAELDANGKVPSAQLPTYPTVGDGTITIQKNGTNVDTFSTNQSSNKTVNITMSKSDVGLGNVDNTSDANKPISTAMQAALDDKADASDIDGIKTVTGNPLTLTDGSETYADELVVDLEPIQSGSGTPSPSNVRPIQGYDIVSVDRCGKNLFDKDSSEIVATSYLYDDGSIGTPASNWKISGWCPIIGGYPLTLYNQGSATAPAICWYDLNKNFIGGQAYNGVSSAITVTPPKNAAYVRFSCHKDYVNTAQLEIGSQATTYTAFTGNDKVNIQLGNKNLLPMTVEGIKAANTDGTWSGNTYTVRGVAFTILTDENGNVVGVKANGTASGGDATIHVVLNYESLSAGKYIVNGSIGGSASTYDIYCGFRINGSATYFNSYNGDSSVITYGASDKIYFIDVRIKNTKAVSNQIFYPMLRDANIVDPTFSPYNPTLGGMVYGGQLTLNDDGSAVFVGTHSVTDLGTLTWTYQSSYTRFYTSYSLMSATPNDQIANAVCSHYPMVAANDVVTPNNNVIGLSVSKNIIIRDTSYTDATTFKTAMSGVQLVYPLATPPVINLSAEQLKLLQGTNNVWSNAGDVTLKYQPDNVIAEPKADVQRLRDDVDDRLVGNASKNIFDMSGFLNADGWVKNADGSYTGQRAKIYYNVYNATENNLHGKVGTLFKKGENLTATFTVYGDTKPRIYFGFNIRNAVTATERNVELDDIDNGTYTLTTNCSNDEFVYSIWFAYSGTGNVTFKNFQIERGTTPTAYEEYYPSNRELAEKIDEVSQVLTTTDSANYNTALNISAYDATKPIFGYVSVISNLSAGANFYIPFSFMKDVVPAGTHNCMAVQGAYSFLFTFTDSPRSIKMVQARDANGNDATTNNTIKFYLYRNY